MDGMSIYSVTSRVYQCEIILAYHENVLCGVSIGGGMPKEARSVFAKYVPMCINNVDEVKARFSTCVVREIHLVPTFEEFWEAYAYKQDKDLALKEWERTKEGDRVAAYVNIPRYNNFIKKKGQAKLYAVRYLKRRTWENDLGK